MSGGVRVRGGWAVAVVADTIHARHDATASGSDRYGLGICLGGEILPAHGLRQNFDFRLPQAP
jgi:hypothetical protein